MFASDFVMRMCRVPQTTDGPPAVCELVCVTCFPQEDPTVTITHKRGLDILHDPVLNKVSWQLAHRRSLEPLGIQATCNSRSPLSSIPHSHTFASLWGANLMRSAVFKIPMTERLAH